MTQKAPCFVLDPELKLPSDLLGSSGFPFFVNGIYYAAQRIVKEIGRPITVLFTMRRIKLEERSWRLPAAQFDISPMRLRTVIAFYCIDDTALRLEAELVQEVVRVDDTTQIWSLLLVPFLEKLLEQNRKGPHQSFLVRDLRRLPAAI